MILKTVRLATSVNAKNDILVPEGSVPSAVVHEVYFQLQASGLGHSPPPDLADRAKAADKDRREMAIYIAKIRLTCALCYQVPVTTMILYKRGDLVLTWKEELISNLIEEPADPYEIVTTDDSRKLATIHVENRIHKPFNFSQTKH